MVQPQETFEELSPGPILVEEGGGSSIGQSYKIETGNISDECE